MPFKNVPMKPETLARRAAERRAEDERAAVAGYNNNVFLAIKTRAEAESDLSRRRLLIECANDWVGAANRWVERAAALGISLDPIPLYDVEDLCGK